MAIVTPIQASDTVVRASGSPARALANVVEDLSLGTVDGPDEYAFAKIQAIALTTNGSVVVLDDAGRGTASVRLYTSTGTFLRKVGGIGTGPGEYQRPHGMTVTRDGRIAVFDDLQRRLTFYSGSGQYLSTAPVQRYATGPGQLTLRTAANGALVLMTAAGRPPQEKISFVMFDSVGQVLDTLPAPELPSLSPLVHRSKTSSRAVVHSYFHGKYMPRPTWAWSPLGYFVTGRTDRYAVDLRIPRRGGKWKEGDPVSSFRLAATRITITARERAEQRALLEGKYRDMPGDALPEIPRQKPFFHGIYVGDEGRIWVRASVETERARPPESRMWEPFVLDVFEITGVYRGRVRLPDNFQPLRFIGDQIIGVATDDMEVNYVRRYRVRWP